MEKGCSGIYKRFFEDDYKMCDFLTYPTMSSAWIKDNFSGKNSYFEYVAINVLKRSKNDID